MTNKRLWQASIVVTVIGLLDSIYLSWSKLTHQAVFCGEYGGCVTVNSSPYSEIAGIPIALIGLGAYLVILAILLLERTGGFWADNGPLMVFGFSLAGLIYSIYLTYLEIWVIHAICPYCVVSAVAILLLFLFTLPRVLRGPEQVKAL